MSELYSQQKALLRIVERSLDNFKKIGKHNYTPVKIRTRMASLKDTWSQCIKVHGSLLHTIPEASRSSMDYFHLNHFETADEVVQSTLDFMAECLEDLEPSGGPQQPTPPATHSGTSSSSLSVSHLPPINIPQFSGKFEEWESFRDLFTSLIIENKSLSAFSRMHFLTSSLVGRARESIANLPVTADNFDIAWNLLKSQFENKRRLIDVHIAALFNLPTVLRESASELSNLRSKANQAIASLRNLKRSSDEVLSDIMVFAVSQKLDAVTKKAWKLRGSDDAEIPTYDDFDRFLASRSRALDELTPPSPSKPLRFSKTLNVNTANVSFPSCDLCKAPHFLNKCPQFIKKSPGQRLEIVKRLNRCINCLSAKHVLQTCQSKYTCRICNRQHHTMLHIDSLSSAATSHSTSHLIDTSETIESSSGNVLSTIRADPSITLLATARVRVHAPSGRSIIVRALIDQGSTMTLITERLRQSLKLQCQKQSASISVVGGVTIGTSRHAARVVITPLDRASPKLTSLATVLKTLTQYLPSRGSPSDSLMPFDGLELADPDPLNLDPIDVMIGSDLYGELIMEGLKKPESSRLVAQRTIFGWIISGPSSGQSHSSPRITVQHCSQSCHLERELRRFWEVEEVPRKALLSPEEQQCEQHFATSHSRSSDGRYIVRLPFKSGPPINIGESRSRAENCLRYLHRRFKTQPHLKVEYAQFLDEYEKLGHMKKVPLHESHLSQSVYIPHHPVVRESSSTTRLRVVFNASSITTNSMSLNDHLLAGPKLQTDLAAVILRWRLYQYVMSADITKMYRQIQIDPRDSQYQRILWSPDGAEPIHAYQLTTVTYGTASAPFLALRVLQQLVADEGHAFPLAVPVMRENIYVDDLLIGADDIPLLRQIRDQVRSLLQCGHFNLRKWSSNSSLLLHDLDAADHGLACHKALQLDEQLKILGISWSPSQDSFQFHVTMTGPIPQTKRSILSLIAKIFDPLGWGTPVIVKAKILLQKLWQFGVGWDENIPSELLKHWTEIHSSLKDLDGVLIPRWIQQGSDTVNCELHGFADASCAAYAAVVYIRVISFSGTINTSLLVSKSKVAPVKSWSIPRLELAAAVLLTRLLEFVKSSLKLALAPCYCWTDSTVVLAWVNQHPSKWKTFVANRVSEIQSRLPTAIWRHVPTQDNPADCASRGLLGHDLQTHPLWWHGPQWLNLSPSEWPLTAGQPTTALEENSRAVIHFGSKQEPWELATKYSSWPKLLRVTAYILRFIDKLKRVKKQEPELGNCSRAVSSDEFNRARIFWLRDIQSEVFPDEMRTLLNRQTLSSKNTLGSLTPFLDEDKLIRVGGRLKHSSLPFTTKHPIVLAPHPLTSLIVRHAHVRSLHAGTQLTMATLRHDYWILRARNLVRSIIHKCVICVREKALVPTQLMGNLPNFRVNPPSRAFLHCGIDYAGPILVRSLSGRGMKSRKAYIAVFICMASRAVHLELVEGYSTPTFIAAFSRFCSRRGLPETVYSDNGTTFTGADRELNQAFRAALQDPDFQNRTSGDRILWKFIPPSAPHFGGLWEAGVRSVKHHLRRVIGAHTLTFEELTTLLCNIEACLNSRPLGPLKDSLDDYESLTPGHFLIGSALTAIPEPSVLSLNENRLSRWQLLRQLSERFWKLWITDYINTLQQRVKWRAVSSQSVRVGQLVLLRNHSLPPCKWELGRVIQCHPGSDGLVRVVSVRTASSEYLRPIGKVCLLPIDIETAEPNTTDQEGGR